MRYQLFLHTGAKNRTDFKTHANFGVIFRRSAEFLLESAADISVQLRLQLALLNSVLYMERRGTCNCGLNGGQIAMTMCSAGQGDEGK